jgi:hypothetical protein
MRTDAVIPNRKKQQFHKSLYLPLLHETGLER